jgi:hypothetical protein
MLNPHPAPSGLTPSPRRILGQSTSYDRATYATKLGAYNTQLSAGQIIGFGSLFTQILIHTSKQYSGINYEMRVSIYTHPI